MKDVHQVFEDGFQGLSRLDEIGFRGCFYLATDLTNIVTYLNFKQGVLIMEVLEGIFNQVGHLFETYNIPEKEGKYIKDKIGQGMLSLSSVYRKDASATYEILTELRFAATDFQFKCLTTWCRLHSQQHTSLGGAV